MSFDDTRHSHAGEVEPITDPDQLAAQEALNGLRQYDAVVEMVDYYRHPERPFKLLNLHRFALDGISQYAGNWRPARIEIGGSKHQPIGAHQVPEMIEDLCDYINSNWNNASPIHLAAYVLWRLNWIHPFTDGNGRTSRAASYLVLCLETGYLLPGRETIPDQIANDKTPYYRALEAADERWVNGRVDLGQMEELLGTLVARQLVSVMNDVTGKSPEIIEK